MGNTVATLTGADIRAWRIEHTLTQEQLAKLLKVTENTVARWERDEVTPPSMLPLALEALDAPLRGSDGDVTDDAGA